MRYSYVTYTGNGSTKLFSVAFDYIAQEHVSVTVDGVSAPFTWINATTVQLVTAPPSGAVIKIARTTPKETALVDFNDASVLTESALDLATKQNLLVAQEGDDKAEDIKQEAIDAAVEAASEAARAVPDNTASDAGKVLRAGTTPGEFAWDDLSDFATDQEVADAVAAEADARTSAINSAVSAEATARDSAISSAVSAEATARANADGLLLPKVGGILTGALTLPANPTAALHAATKQYVDAIPLAKVQPISGSWPTATFDPGVSETVFFTVSLPARTRYVVGWLTAAGQAGAGSAGTMTLLAYLMNAGGGTVGAAITNSMRAQANDFASLTAPVLFDAGAGAVGASGAWAVRLNAYRNQPFSMLEYRFLGLAICE